jgi:hypothetical protein
MRKCAAVPLLSATVSSHVPDFAFAPEAAFASQSLGRVIVASTVPLFAVEQSAGAAPVLIVRMGAVPIAVSIASRAALRAAVEN